MSVLFSQLRLSELVRWVISVAQQIVIAVACCWRHTSVLLNSAQAAPKHCCSLLLCSYWLLLMLKSAHFAITICVWRIYASVALFNHGLKSFHLWIAGNIIVNSWMFLESQSCCRHVNRALTPWRNRCTWLWEGDGMHIYLLSSAQWIGVQLMSIWCIHS